MQHLDKVYRSMLPTRGQRESVVLIGWRNSCIMVNNFIDYPNSTL